MVQGKAVRGEFSGDTQGEEAMRHAAILFLTAGAKQAHQCEDWIQSQSGCAGVAYPNPAYPLTSREAF